ncbi:hypothetical protein ACWKWC_00925 [Geodermatophilus nigrescens]
MRPSRLVAVTVLFVAGCSTSVTGTATQAPPAAVSPTADALESLALDPDDEGRLRVSDVAAAPDGGIVVLLIPEADSDSRSRFLQLVPDDGGLAVGAVTEAVAFANPSELVVTPDGTAVALATVPLESGDPSLDGFDGPDLALAVLAPGAGDVELRRVEGDGELGRPDSGNGVLSPDGATLYTTLRWTVDGETVTRLATVDIATAQVTATAPLGVESATAYDVALRPDGGVAVLVSAGGDVDRTLVAEFDADLQPVRPPVELAEGSGYALTVRPDGTVVASVSTPADGEDRSRLVTVRGEVVQPALQLPGVAVDLAVAADGRLLHVGFARAAADGTASPTLATVDLVAEEVVETVTLCAGGFTSPFTLAADGRSIAATAGCYEDGVWQDRAFLIG